MASSYHATLDQLSDEEDDIDLTASMNQIIPRRTTVMRPPTFGDVPGIPGEGDPNYDVMKYGALSFPGETGLESPEELEEKRKKHKKVGIKGDVAYFKDGVRTVALPMTGIVDTGEDTWEDSYSQPGEYKGRLTRQMAQNLKDMQVQLDNQNRNIKEQSESMKRVLRICEQQQEEIKSLRLLAIQASPATQQPPAMIEDVKE